MSDDERNTVIRIMGLHDLRPGGAAMSAALAALATAAGMTLLGVAPWWA